MIIAARICACVHAYFSRVQRVILIVTLHDIHIDLEIRRLAYI